MPRLRWLFFALGLIGGVLLLFTQVGRRYTTIDTPVSDDLRPEAYLSAYQIRFYHPSGDLFLNLAGPRLTHHSETRINRAHSPEIAYHDPDGRHVVMLADSAIYPFSGKVFTLSGNVEVSQFEVNSLIPDFILTTRDLVYYPHTRDIFTPSLVTMVTPEAQLTAVGIEGNLNDHRFVLQNHVQGIFHYE